jgi:F-type H+-transporting ATPase subunit b
MKNKCILAAALLFFPAVLFAAERGESRGLDDHQVKVIIYQSINVTIMFIGLWYFLRKSVREHFQTKRNNFVVAAEKAQKMREAAEQERVEIQLRLSRLQSTADESVARARAEAADYKNALIAEAKEVSKRIKKEAEDTAIFEVERARNHLRAQMIKEATALAAGQMESKLTSEDQRRLQGEFIEHIQGVKS